MATRAPSRPKLTSTDTVTVKAEDAPTTLLLIGSTGNGKSTLGNFLLDPRDRHIFGKEQTFRTARDNRPETQTQVESGKRAVRIIDTPSLNESAIQDLSHMIDIVKTLNSVESISACILCLKFESKIDSQYKATVAYYKKLLPRLFGGNVVIVLTQYQTDPRSEKLRELQGVDIDAIVTNAQKEVRDAADLCYYPQVFKIDSLPVMEDERELSEGTRQAILEFIRATMTPVFVSDLKVAKTDELRQIDDKTIEKVSGEIGGYNERLKQANSKAAKVLSRIERDEKFKIERDNGLKSEHDELKRNIEERLEEYQEYLEEMRLLREYITERNETKQRLSRDPIPIAEALQRLEHLHVN